MWTDLITWISGGVVFVLLYLIISNTLWLLFGSRVIQFLPGVNINGSRGTLKIAAMLVLAIIGFLVWTVKYAYRTLLAKDEKPALKDEIALSIRAGAKWAHRNDLPNSEDKRAPD